MLYLGQRLPKRSASPRQSRFHRAQIDVEGEGNFTVFEVVVLAQQKGGLKVWRQGSDRAGDGTAEPLSLGACVRGRRRARQRHGGLERHGVEPAPLEVIERQARGDG